MRDCRKELIQDLLNAVKVYRAQIDEDDALAVILDHLAYKYNYDGDIAIDYSERYDRPWVVLPDNVCTVLKGAGYEIIEGDGLFVDELLSAALNTSLGVECYRNDGVSLDAYFTETAYNAFVAYYGGT